MRFTKKYNISIIIRLTGSQDNILGVSFGEKNKLVRHYHSGNEFKEV